MFLQNEKYRVDVSVAPSIFEFEKEAVLNPGNHTIGELSKAFVVQVSCADREYQLIIIGSYLSSERDCASLEGEILTLLLNDSIQRINLHNGTLIQYEEIPGFDCGIGLYKISDGYILYGEMEIIMIDLNLMVKWRYSGSDIFVAMDDSKAFEMREEAIYLQDFEGNKYTVSYEGKSLNYIPIAKSNR